MIRLPAADLRLDPLDAAGLAGRGLSQHLLRIVEPTDPRRWLPLCHEPRDLSRATPEVVDHCRGSEWHSIEEFQGRT